MNNNIELNEELGEVICPVCNGCGKMPSLYESDKIAIMCKKCQGLGKLDWCEKAVGVKPILSSIDTSGCMSMSFPAFTQEYIGDWKMTPIQEAFFNKLSKETADKIDKEILESLSANAEQNIKNKQFVEGV